MGFVSGFAGGATLTLGIAYLTVLSHERHRTSQALHLRTQSTLLTSLFQPIPKEPPPSRAEIARASRATFVEEAKDRWNGEVEGMVRRVQNTDWENVRQGMEGAVARFLGLGLEKGREGVERVEGEMKPIAADVVERAKAGAASAGREVRKGAETAARKTGDVVDRAGVKATEAASATKATADRAAASAQSTWDRGVEKSRELKAKAERDVPSPAGTVDAARGLVRDVVGKGIEKGQELIGKAQAAVGIATERTKAAVDAKTTTPSDVEKALSQRYEKLHGLDKTVEETLEERYKPIDQRT